MSIKITSDSTCDLDTAMLHQADVSVFPLYIIKDGVPLKDGAEISPADIFDHVAAGNGLTTTAAINIDDYITYFSQFSSDYDAVIHINLGAEFSSCHQNATVAAQEFSNVYTVNSANLSSGHGVVVMEAVRCAHAGMAVADIVDHLNDFTARVESSFILSQLTYLHKGGRCSSVAALGANLLKLKPCIQVVDGKMQVGKKYRGSFEKCVTEYVNDQLQGRDDLSHDMIFVVHAACPEGLVDQVCTQVAQHAPFQVVATPSAGCTISSHCGPCTLGLMFARQA